MDENSYKLDAQEKRIDGWISALEKMEQKFDTKLDLIILQLNKIPLLESNHSVHSDEINKLKTTVADLVTFKDRADGAATTVRAIWAIFGATIIGILVKVF